MLGCKNTFINLSINIQSGSLVNCYVSLHTSEPLGKTTVDLKTLLADAILIF